MGTEGTMINEKCQTKKDKYHIISHKELKKKTYRKTDQPGLWLPKTRPRQKDGG